MGDHDNRIGMRCEFGDPKPCSLFSLLPLASSKAREMPDILEQYSSLSPSSDSSQVNVVLGQIISGRQVYSHSHPSPHPSTHS